MKRRNKLVSNSSSSSFCLYGYEASKEEALEALKNYKGYGDGVTPTKDDLYCYFVEDPDERYWYYGLELVDMRDDETKAEFKARVEKLVEEMFGKPMPCEIHEKAFYNG